MKNLIFIILLAILPLTVNSQSDRKINRNSKESGLYIRASLPDSVAGSTFDRTIFCEETLVTHFVNKRHFIAHSYKFELDLTVVHRNIGEYKSWLAFDEKAERYFFITPFRFEKDGFGVIIQPVDKKYNRLYDLPVITIANFNVCQP